MQIEKQLIEIYKNAVISACYNNTPFALMQFKSEHPNEFVYLQKFYRVRTELNKDIETMKQCGCAVYWCTLTFDDNIKRDDKLMRRKAFRFLNEIFALWVAVEEYGEDNERYHIHFFGCFRHDKKYEDFFAWSSREKIEYLNDYKIKKKVRYLTNYAAKCCPRLHRNKRLVAARKEYQKKRSFENYHFNFYDEKFKSNITSLFDDDLPF